MEFHQSKPRLRGESRLPMINVVFQLLIFFLMTAQIAPPEPFDVVLPEATAASSGEGLVLIHLSADGETAFRAFRGEAAIAEDARVAGRDGLLLLRADKALEIAEVARALLRVAKAGVTDVRIGTLLP